MRYFLARLQYAVICTLIGALIGESVMGLALVAQAAFTWPTPDAWFLLLPAIIFALIGLRLHFEVHYD